MKLFYITIVCFSMTICSCLNKEYINVETIISSQFGNMHNLKIEIEKKLLDEGFDQNEVGEITNDGKLVIKSKIESKDVAYYNTLLQSNRLDLWNTYRVSDNEIQKIDFTKIEIDAFNSFREFEKGHYPNEVIGSSRDESKLKDISLILEDSLSDLSNLKLVWSKEKEGIKKDEYLLYMINTGGDEASPVTEIEVENSEVKKDNYSEGYAVMFEFDEKGTEIWGKMTEEAASDDNRSIAIVLNDRLYSCPRVMDRISSGNCMISGNFDKKEAEKLAYGLMLRRYSNDLQIENQAVSNAK